MVTIWNLPPNDGADGLDEGHSCPLGRWGSFMFGSWEKFRYNAGMWVFFGWVAWGFCAVNCLTALLSRHSDGGMRWLKRFQGWLLLAGLVVTLVWLPGWKLALIPWWFVAFIFPMLAMSIKAQS